MEGKRLLSKGLVICAALAAILAVGLAPAQAAQVQLPGNKIPQFVDPLPVLDIQGGPMKTILTKPFSTTTSVELHTREFKSSVMPSTFVPAVGTYTGTTVWGYIEGSLVPAGTQGTYIGPIFVVGRGTPTTVKFVNNLGNTATSLLPFWANATDQTLHWADPLNGEVNMGNHMTVIGQPPMSPYNLHYTGPIPTVPHLHGGEVPPVIDGGPDAWFLSEPPNTTTNPNAREHGHQYYSRDGATVGNYAIYRYPNNQQAAPTWMHEHTLGVTRINVYAGLAGGYLQIDPLNPPPGDLADPTKIIPLVLQDRMFDTNGELFFPSTGINVEHPYWIPEFVGDTIVVNGKVWPFVNVAPKRYRFLFVNGSNARTYEMFLKNFATGALGPPIWQIATDGGYLDKPVKIDSAAKKGALKKLLIMPGERADVIIDFSQMPVGTSLVLRNTGRTPYPAGAFPKTSTLGRIIQFRVVASSTLPSVTFDPSTLPALRTPMVRLADPATGTIAAGVTVSKTRVLTLNEITGAGGPLEILVNNTKWDGKRADAINGSVPTGFKPVSINGITDYYSELPNEGDTEEWEIVNLTADAHPIHTHLTQFQLVNRQGLNVKTYNKAYGALFPGGTYYGANYLPGVYVPAFGPPMPYFPADQTAAQLAATGGKLGGNPDVDAVGAKGPLYLKGAVMPPDANEAGWKDTIRAMPGQVTRILVRYAPSDKPVADPNLNFPFDPQALGRGYVWHCHILDHEDNEMMRPLQVQPKAGVTRTYIQGVDY